MVSSLLCDSRLSGRLSRAAPFALLMLLCGPLNAAPPPMHVPPASTNRVAATEAPLPPATAGGQPPSTNCVAATAAPRPSPKPSVGHRVLCYLPNRVVDLIDIFRARLRVGPGLSAGIQATSRLEFYGGGHKTVYVGLPGPRNRRKLRSPIGRESRYGLVFAGVDATDDTPHPPHYTPSEFTAGAQLLVVGADVGLDIIEIADFVCGWFLLDLRKDDF